MAEREQYNTYEREQRINNSSNLNNELGQKRKPPVPTYNKYNRNYNNHGSKNIDLYNPTDYT